MNQFKLQPIASGGLMLLLLLLAASGPGLITAVAANAVTPMAGPVLAQQQEPPPEEESPAPPAEEAPAPVVEDVQPDFVPGPVPEIEPGASDSEPRTVSRTPDGSRATPAIVRTTPALTDPSGERNLHLNFRGAPLELVLDYLSESAGFIIDLQTEVKGKVDVWSSQALTRDEAVDVLNSVLNRNGYAAIRTGRKLTIVSREDARKMNIPVISGGDPGEIPNNDEMVTQIIPVRFINATQLTKDLEPLMPSQASMTANEGGNALVITDTQSNIRRMAEIVRALDTAVSSTSTIRVFELEYADAKSLATVVQELFQTQDTQQRSNNAMQQFFRGQGGPFNQQRNNSQTESSGGRVSAPRVVATADERSNSLVVSAPEDHMPAIEALVAKVDTDVEEVTEVRVFRLAHADAQETADLLTDLFPDTTTSNQNNRNRVQFGGRGGPQLAVASASSTPSSRMQMQTKVTAVPDLRTGSVVVSAARNIMAQIAQMIEVLDADPAKQQKVFVFDVENTDPQVVQEVLQNLFPNQNSSSASANRSSQAQTGNQLNTRASQSQSQTANNNNTLGGMSGGTAAVQELAVNAPAHPTLT